MQNKQRKLCSGNKMVEKKTWYPIKYIDDKRYTMLNVPRRTKKEAIASAEYAKSRGWKARVITDKTKPKKYGVFIRKGK